MLERQRELRAEFDRRMREVIRRRIEREQSRAAVQGHVGLGMNLEVEVDRRFDRLMEIEVPSSADLREMQARGELPSDDELAPVYP